MTLPVRLMRGLLLLLAWSCATSHSSQSPTWEEEDKSIRFPKFYERFPVQTDAPGEMYALDGVTLKAITIAINDFLPPITKKTLCWRKPEAHDYRFIRLGDIIFVRIGADTEACNLRHGLLDYGVQYAISTEGRILRRLYDGEPEDWSTPAT